MHIDNHKEEKLTIAILELVQIMGLVMTRTLKGIIISDRNTKLLFLNTNQLYNLKSSCKNHVGC